MAPATKTTSTPLPIQLYLKLNEAEQEASDLDRERRRIIAKEQGMMEDRINAQFEVRKHLLGAAGADAASTFYDSMTPILQAIVEEHYPTFVEHIPDSDRYYFKHYPKAGTVTSAKDGRVVQVAIYVTEA